VETILEGRGLARTYWLGATPVTALAGVDITIRRGEFLVLQGPSGSGKTTLINLLGLLDRPDGGTLDLDGASVAQLDENARADLRRDRFGFVFQSFNLVAVLTASENVEYPMLLKGVPRETRRLRAVELLSRVGLSDKAEVRPDLLSGGQRQRVAIARALANEPEVILADEPTANLDTKTADDVLDLMSLINEERRVAFVLSSHDPRVILRAQRVLTLRDGRIAGNPSTP
jgi:putative ABC transport system ATP-binding protein